MCQATTIHAFEQAGLGRAPFRYLGIEAQTVNSNGERVLSESGGVAVSTTPGGTCAYCGTYIVDMYRVESSDGKRFHVGCDCIRKVGGAGLIRQIDADRRKLERNKRHSREDAKRAELSAWYAENRQRCEGLPHPKKFQDKTLADYVDWMRKNAGTSGELGALSLAKKILETG